MIKGIPQSELNGQKLEEKEQRLPEKWLETTMEQRLTRINSELSASRQG
jgi:hypothetical protein